MIFQGRRIAAAEAEAEAARAEAGELRRRAATVEAALDVLPLGFVVRHADGSRVRNGVARAMAGARTADVLADQAVEEVLADAASGRARTRTLELHGPPRRVLVISARPVDGGVAAVVEDVTARHQLEAVRRDFVANVSHELRTPIGALAVLAETITSSDDPEVIRRLAGRMSGEVSRATRLIDDLLDLSRIETTGLRDPAPVDLLAVVIAAVERAEDGDRVHVVAPSEPVEVVGDGDQLTSAVANLVGNALKYSEPGSPVTVTVADADDGATVEVRDLGVGIPSRDLDRIFERFYRVDQARSRDTGGTGLGLSIVRHVAVNHGGDVTVESVEGQGSTFTMRLPRRSR